MRTETHYFENSEGHRLAAKLDQPVVGRPLAYALFAHCFTCGKDLKVIHSIAEALAAKGIAVFRFDFPGLGQSEGAFAATTFTSNVDDLYRASEYLESIAEAPQIVIGHSLGGAAALRVAPLLDSVRAVVTIGAPADPAHVVHLLDEKRDEIEKEGEAEVKLAGRKFRIRQEFINDLESISMEEATAKLGKALLVLHSPVDEIVGIENAATIYGRAKHPKSFLSLDSADHLLTKEADSTYAGLMIAGWVERYLEVSASGQERGDEVVARIGRTGFQTNLLLNGVPFLADEPADLGGTDQGPSPYDFLLGALGACTAMTLRMYADHKKLMLDSVTVRLNHKKIDAADCADCQTDAEKIDEIERTIELVGDLSEEQKARILEIADRCPVHRTLESEVKVRSKLV